MFNILGQLFQSLSLAHVPGEKTEVLWFIFADRTNGDQFNVTYRYRVIVCVGLAGPR